MLNTAGTSGGVLDISKNFIIERCIFSNNSARYGGAIEYDSYEYYGHVQDHINIYNSTISNNRALNGGGAFNIGYANIIVRNTNIVNNVAPSGNTIHSRVIGGHQDIDMRYNYWGKKGPDDSVWRAMSRDSFYPITREMINWNPQVVDDNDPSNPIEVNPDDDSKEHGGNGGDSRVNPTPSTTDSSTSTGRNIGGNGNNYGSGTGSGGNGGSGNPGTPYNPGNAGNTNSYGHIPGNTYTGQKVIGNYNSRTSNANSKVDGTSDSNSQSKINSSNHASSLSTVGMISNAAASSGSDGGQGEGSNSADSSDSGPQSVSKSYEITEKLEEIIDDDTSMLTNIILVIIILFLLIIGYKRKEKESED